MRILLLGGSGKLGSQLIKFLVSNGHHCSSQGRSNISDFILNANDSIELESLIVKFMPEVIINLNALTDVDLCQKNHGQAIEANYKSCQTLSRIIKKYRINTIHISTDQVYSKKTPSKENEANPINIYAMSKLLGEYEILSPYTVVLRTNYISFDEKYSNLNWIIDSVLSKKKITLFKDNIFSPLDIFSLMEKIKLVVENFKPGVYNLGAVSEISKADFYKRILLNIGYSESLIDVIDSKIVKNQARSIRPLSMSMDSSLFSKQFDTYLPNIEEVINSSSQALSETIKIKKNE